MAVSGKFRLLAYNFLHRPQAKVKLLYANNSQREIIHGHFIIKVVVMASKGYPGSYKKGSVIQNLEEAEQVAPSVKISHAGTVFDPDGSFIATGGRVLGVTEKGKDLQEARDRAYQAVQEINWSGGFYRRDSGWRAFPREQFATKE